MNLLEHAKQELKLTGYDPDEADGPDRWIQDNILELIKVFSEQGHSGSSAGYCLDVFNKLASWEPLAPLAGTDDEWSEVSQGVFQNLRCSHIFKQKDRFDGQAYDINGKVFREPNGNCYTSSDSFVPIIFPYTPKSEIVDVPARD